MNAADTIVGLTMAMKMVERFHEKVVGCPTQRVDQLSIVHDGVTKTRGAPREGLIMHSSLHGESQSLLAGYKTTGDQCYLRGHLIVEETAELLDAMYMEDEVLVLDALADLLYVVLGSAVTMDLPLAEAFVEVHRSNMTKRRQSDDPDGARVRDKGEGYQPPDLKRILDAYRATQPVQSL